MSKRNKNPIVLDGYVYCVKNPSFPGIYKIGCTEKTIHERVREMDNTSVPTPFIPVYGLHVKCRCMYVEKMIHECFSERRVRQKREFFTEDINRIERVFRSVSKAMGCRMIFFDENGNEIKDHITEENTFVSPKMRNTFKSTRRCGKKLNLSSWGIKVGDTLEFYPTKKIVTVVSEQLIEYDGEQYTLSGFAKKYMPDDRRNPSEKYPGPNYFKFNGTKLDTLRSRIQKSA